MNRAAIILAKDLQADTAAVSVALLAGQLARSTSWYHSPATDVDGIEHCNPQHNIVVLRGRRSQLHNVLLDKPNGTKAFALTARSRATSNDPVANSEAIAATSVGSSELDGVAIIGPHDTVTAATKKFSLYRAEKP